MNKKEMAEPIFQTHGGVLSGTDFRPKKNEAAFALIFGLLVVSPNVHADALLWKSNGPPAGVDTIAVAPSDSKIVYAGSTGTDGGKGVFKSADGGRAWAAVNHGIANRRINAVAVDPLHSQIVYAGYEGEGFYKTADGGENWATINTAPVHHGTAVAIDPVDTNILYLGTDSGMFKSVDGGKTLTRLNNGQSEAGSVVCIVIDPHDRRTVYISKYHDKLENCGIWKSTDAGATWVAASVGISGGPERLTGVNQKVDAARMTFGLAIDPQQPGVLYAGTLGRGVFKTTDGAAHWVHASDGINTGMSFGDNVYSLAVDPNNPAVVYAGTAGGGIFKTSDAGKHWVGESQGLPPQSDHGNMIGIIWALAADEKTRTLFAGHYANSDGVYAAKLPSAPR